MKSEAGPYTTSAVSKPFRVGAEILVCRYRSKMNTRETKQYKLDGALCPPIRSCQWGPPAKANLNVSSSHLKLNKYIAHVCRDIAYLGPINYICEIKCNCTGKLDTALWKKTTLCAAERTFLFIIFNALFTITRYNKQLIIMNV